MRKPILIDKNNTDPPFNFKENESFSLKDVILTGA